jgi:hypothetical protein
MDRYATGAVGLRFRGIGIPKISEVSAHDDLQSCYSITILISRNNMQTNAAIYTDSVGETKSIDLENPQISYWQI